MTSTVGQHDIYMYLKEHGWTPVQLLADQLKVSKPDLMDELMDMEVDDLVVFDDKRGVNISLRGRSYLSRWWASIFGY